MASSLHVHSVDMQWRQRQFFSPPSPVVYVSDFSFSHRCHLGKTIVYDTVSNASWTVDIRTHGIVNVIERLLADPWPPAMELGREVPEAQADVDCVVCGISVSSLDFSLKSNMCYFLGVLQLGVRGFSVLSDVHIHPILL
jgi:hypothetical protein